jgi:hypothetical protein
VHVDREADTAIADERNAEFLLTHGLRDADDRRRDQ